MKSGRYLPSASLCASLYFFWNSTTALLVPFPRIPSILPVSNPLDSRAIWTAIIHGVELAVSLVPAYGLSLSQAK